MSRRRVCPALLLSSLMGCAASTSFVPPNDHRVYLVLEDDEMALMRDAKLINLVSDPASFAAWDSLAQATGATALDLYWSGQKEMAVGGVLMIFLPPVGLAILGSGETKVNLARAQLIDAMNIQNDAEAVSGHRDLDGDGGR